MWRQPSRIQSKKKEVGANPIVRMLFMGMTMKVWINYAREYGEKLKAAEELGIEYATSGSDENDYTLHDERDEEDDSEYTDNSEDDYYDDDEEEDEESNVDRDEDDRINEVEDEEEDERDYQKGTERASMISKKND